MKQNYTYDELYGTLLHRNKDDTERTYFIIECLKYTMYRWMFKEGWNKISEKPTKRNGLKGIEIILHR